MEWTTDRSPVRRLIMSNLGRFLAAWHHLTPIAGTPLLAIASVALRHSRGTTQESTSRTTSKPTMIRLKRIY